MRPILALLIAIAFATQVHAEDAEIASLFSEAGVEGTIVIEKLDGNQRYVHNEDQGSTAVSLGVDLQDLQHIDRPGGGGADGA